jgi:hypothetical protein
MKTILCLTFLSLVTVLTAQEKNTPVAAKITIQELYQRAVTEMNQGKVAAAEQDFQAILRAQPQHPQALYALNLLKSNRANYAARSRLHRMKAIQIDRVDYADASLTEALESLSAQVTKASADKFVPNFIVKDPQKKFESAQLTLQLQNVPASQVLNYIVDHVQAKVLYEEHAILIIAP